MIPSKVYTRALRGLAAVVMLIPMVTSVTPVGAVAPTQSAVAPRVASPAPKSAFGALPLRFDANRGQAATGILYEANSAGITSIVTARGVSIRLLTATTFATATPTHLTTAPKTASPASSALLQFRLVNGNLAARPVAVKPLAGLSNYFIGADPTLWRTGVPGYRAIVYRSAYTGIDLVYQGSPGTATFEYAFGVHPWAYTSKITVSLGGITSMHLDTKGNLVLSIGGLNLLQLRPVAYQDYGGRRHAISASYILRSANTIGFKIGTYNHGYSLVIDPVLTYSTYLGGSGFDAAYGVAVDSAGSAYLTGVTTSSDFPTAASVYGANVGHAHVFVSKLNPAGTGLVYSTYIGGSGDEEGRAIAVDGSGRAVIAGTTTSADFPLAHAAQTMAVCIGHRGRHS